MFKTYIINNRAARNQAESIANPNSPEFISEYIQCTSFASKPRRAPQKKVPQCFKQLLDTLYIMHPYAKYDLKVLGETVCIISDCKVESAKYFLVHHDEVFIYKIIGIEFDRSDPNNEKIIKVFNGENGENEHNKILLAARDVHEAMKYHVKFAVEDLRDLYTLEFGSAACLFKMLDFYQMLGIQANHICDGYTIEQRNPSQ